VYPCYTVAMVHVLSRAAWIRPPSALVALQSVPRACPILFACLAGSGAPRPIRMRNHLLVLVVGVVLGACQAFLLPSFGGMTPRGLVVPEQQHRVEGRGVVVSGRQHICMRSMAPWIGV
jgi:hypothetical protein